MLAAILLALLLPNAYAVNMVMKVGETQIFGANIDQPANATWYLDQNVILTEESNEYNHTFTYTYSPNETNIGYHNITFFGQNDNGEVSKEWTIFVGTLFLVNGTVNNNTVNATTESILAEPMGSFNLTTFVENNSATLVSLDGENRIEYKASASLLNLSGTVSGIGTNIRLSNGTKYFYPFNTMDKNGTFLFSMNGPAAETADGQRINVSVTAGQVKISPRYDIDANFAVNIIDYTILNQNWGKTGDAMCPQWQKRCDINKDNIVNIVDKTLLQQKMGKPIITI